MASYVLLLLVLAHHLVALLERAGDLGVAVNLLLLHLFVEFDEVARDLMESLRLHVNQ